MEKKTEEKSKQIQISDYDFKRIDIEFLHKVVTKSCNCPHKFDPTNFYSFEYRDGGISVEFSKGECLGQGILYLSIKDCKPTSIDCIVECQDLAE